MKVAIGSTNPVKISAVKQAFKKVWPRKKFNFQSVKVNSGVSHQPVSDIEGIKGAKTRARQAMKILNADFGIGLEGNLHKVGNRWYDSGWIVVLDKKGNEGIGCSMRIETPPKMMKHIRKGLELGEVDDIFFKTKNSKQEQGHFGLMTKNAIFRKDGYMHAVVAALVRFIHPKLFK